MRYKIDTEYIKDRDITKFILYYGPSLSSIKIVEKEGNLLTLDKDFDMNKVMYTLKEYSKYEK